MKMLKITLKRSLIGRPEKQRKILRSFGLRKINQSVEQKDIPSVRGVIHKISHMVKVTEAEGKATKGMKPE